MSLLGRLKDLDHEKTVNYIEQCRNFDGGFGTQAGAESHASQGDFQPLMLCQLFHSRSNAVYVCLGSLAILDRLDLVDTPTLGWWLAERQLPNGGLNGRPEKLEDVRALTILLHAFEND